MEYKNALDEMFIYWLISYKEITPLARPKILEAFQTFSMGISLPVY